MTGSYFYKKIILIIALVAFLVGGFYPTNTNAALSEAQRNALMQEGGGGNPENALKGTPTATFSDAQRNALIKENNSGNTAEARQLNGNQPPSGGGSSKNDEITCIKWFGGTVPYPSPEGCIAVVTFTVLQIASWVLWLAAILFNATINYTLNMAGFIKDIPIVDVGWTVFRDVANLLFIFIILYIAINTIIGNEGYGIKKLLSKVIIGAMLINFSLFFTQAMIDGSNIIALQFYHKIIQDSNKSNTSAGKSANNTDYDSGISAAFVNAMGLQQIYFLGSGTSQGSVATDVKGSNLQNTKLGLNAKNLILVSLGGTVLVLITAFVFFAGTFMLLARTVVLIFLMILSPIAFMGNILPALGKYTGDWWSKLTGNLLFAPVYMMLLYLVMNMITGENFKKAGGNGTFADMFAGGNNWIPTIMTFIVLIMLMVGCLIISAKLGVIGGKWAEKTGLGLAGSLGMKFSGAGLGLGATRSLLGGGANALLQNETVKRFAPNSMMRGLDSVRSAKFGGKSFMDAQKAKDDKLKKAYDLSAEVRQGAGESDGAFKIRKKASQAAAYSRLGINANKDTGLPEIDAKGNVVKATNLTSSQKAMIASKDIKDETVQKKVLEQLTDAEDTKLKAARANVFNAIQSKKSKEEIAILRQRAKVASVTLKNKKAEMGIIDSSRTKSELEKERKALAKMLRTMRASRTP